MIKRKHEETLRILDSIGFNTVNMGEFTFRESGKKPKFTENANFTPGRYTGVYCWVVLKEHDNVNNRAIETSSVVYIGESSERPLKRQPQHFGGDSGLIKWRNINDWISLENCRVLVFEQVQPMNNNFPNPVKPKWNSHELQEQLVWTNLFPLYAVMLFGRVPSLRQFAYKEFIFA